MNMIKDSLILFEIGSSAVATITLNIQQVTQNQWLEKSKKKRIDQNNINNFQQISIGNKILNAIDFCIRKCIDTKKCKAESSVIITIE